MTRCTPARLPRTAALALATASTLACGSAAAQDAARELRAAWPGTPMSVVIDEGAAEPRSIGSYAVRLYDGRRGATPYDAYVTGIVRPRDGTLGKADFADIDGDGSTELVVVMRSAGSGGYLAADAFRLRHGVLSRVTGVEGLAPTADVVAELRKAAAR